MSAIRSVQNFVYHRCQSTSSSSVIGQRKDPNASAACLYVVDTGALRKSIQISRTVTGIKILKASFWSLLSVWSVTLNKVLQDTRQRPRSDQDYLPFIQNSGLNVSHRQPIQTECQSPH